MGLVGLGLMSRDPTNEVMFRLDGFDLDYRLDFWPQCHLCGVLCVLNIYYLFLGRLTVG
jgi:hypothetical protein